MEKFEQIRSHPNEIFPFPEDGQVVLENPPRFIWIADPENNAQGYEVVIRGGNGFERRLFPKRFCCFLTEPLPAGRYSWNVYSGGKERGWQSFTVPENAVEFIGPSAEELYDAIPEHAHPRALFEKEDIPQILEDYPEQLQTLKNNIALALTQGLPPFPELEGPDEPSNHYRHARTYTNIMRDYADRNMIACGLGWQLLGDAAAGEMGKKLLLHFASWDLNHPFTSIFAPYDEMGLSIARTLPTAFDLLYDLLTEEERKIALQAIATMAKQCYDRIGIDDYEGHPGLSHVGRIPGYLGEAAMMLKGVLDKAQVLEYLRAVTDIYSGVFPHYGSQDGGWGEGTFYASSYTKWFLPFFLQVERYTGKSYLDRPFYQNLSHYFLHFADPDFENHPFGDGYWCHSEDEEWPGFFAQDPFRVYAQKFGPEEAVQRQHALRQPQIFRLHLMDIFLPRLQKPKKHITRPASLAEAFPQTGVFSMRTGFETKDCLAVMGRASRYGSASHSHADHGSFALFYEGVSLISPSGYYGSGYGTKHHYEWTNHSKAHNTILVDGQGMLTFSESSTGKVESCVQEGELFTALLNLNQAYGQIDSWTRRFTMDAAAKTLTVEDTLCSKEEHTLQWLLHSLGEPVAEGSKVMIERKGIRLTIEPLEGLLPEAEIKDEYDVKINEGARGQYNKLVLPKQYHMKWQTASAKIHRIAVKLTVIKLEADDV